MKLHLVFELIFAFGFTSLFFVPLSRKRVRTRWANWLFVAVAAVGLAYTAVQIAMDQGLIGPKFAGEYGLAYHLSFVRGLIVGVLLSLLFSGQAIGTKRE